MSLLPREHGAYGQIAAPLVTSYAVAGVTSAALLIGLAAVAAFLAHEPLLVLLGRRGSRVRQVDGRRAMRWLTVSTAAAGAAGIWALWLASGSLRWSLLLPLVPASWLVAAVSRNREKSAGGELAVALAGSLAAVPACLAAGASARTAAAIAVAFGAIFVTATLAVRGIVLAVRGGGDPEAARSTRSAVVTLTIGVSAGVGAASVLALLPWTTLAAAAPGLGAAAWLAVYPPPPTHLRAVGWTLMATTGAAVLILYAGLRP